MNNDDLSEQIFHCLVKEIEYLYVEGFVNIEWHPEHPNDLAYAKISAKTDAEILNDIENILNS